MKTAGELLTEALRSMGADGLCSEECGCLIGDLAPCDMPTLKCVPGRRVDHKAFDECGCPCDDIDHWHVEAMEES